MCFRKKWRELFDIKETEHYLKGQVWKACRSTTISKPIEDILTVGSYISWAHIDAGGTSRISFLPHGSEIMKQ